MNPRYRVLNALGKTLKRQLGGHTLRDDIDDDGLPEGYMQIHSFFLPGLQYGTYQLATNQTVYSLPDKSDTLNLINNSVDGTKGAHPQMFNVLVPQFSLPAGAIHSCYPPSGQSVDANILPHIVFNDSHLPWECGTGDRTAPVQTPWMALMVFRQSELKLSPQDMASISPAITTQSAMLDVGMQVSDFLALGRAISIPTYQDNSSPPKLDPKVDVTTAMKAIFITKDMFTTLFRNQDPAGSSDKPFLDRYQQLAHVRNVNTLHTADAGTQDQGTFSVVIASRTGPLNTADTTDLIVHLVSLETVDKMDWPPKASHVGLVSLYSWSFKARSAEGAFNVQIAMRNIGNQSSKFLRVPDSALNSLKQATPEEKAIYDRFSAGYSLVRQRTESGHQTVAYTRGPLAPYYIPHPLAPQNSPWPANSNSGKEFEIHDPAAGIVDISYRTAWQLGKALAVADSPFCAAIGRLRHKIHQGALNLVKVGMAGDAHRSREDIVGSLTKTHDVLSSFGKANPMNPVGAHLWLRTDKSLYFDSQPKLRTKSDYQNAYAQKVQEVAKKLTLAYDPTKPGGNRNANLSTAALLYNEFNSPVDSDWAIVLSWVLNHMFLAGIPPQYLVGDPSYLPEESIRFFYVDANWVDVFIDGALSISNQLTFDDDHVRTEIKANLNAYLAALDKKAQIPIYGFFLRSRLVKVFPDLKVQATLPSGDARTPNPYTKRLAEDILMVLVDRLPGDSDLIDITITQPPHQQCFRLGTRLDETDGLVYDIREAFTVNIPAGHGNFQTVETVTVKPGAADALLYDFKTNILNVPLLAKAVKNTLLAKKPAEFQDPNSDPTKPGSAALVALQLNDSIWYLKMLPPQASNSPLHSGPRQIYGVKSGVNRATPVAAPPKSDIGNTVPVAAPQPAAGGSGIGSNPKPQPIPSPPISPRPPNFMRIRPDKEEYEFLPSYKDAVLSLLELSIGTSSDPDNKMGIVAAPQPTRTPSNGPGAPSTLHFNTFFQSGGFQPGLVSEVIIHLPLNVPAFKSAFTPPNIPGLPDPAKLAAQFPSVPFIEPDLTHAHIIKLLGGASSRWSAQLTVSDRFLNVRLRPKTSKTSQGGTTIDITTGERFDFLLGGLVPFNPKTPDPKVTTYMSYLPVTVVWLQSTPSPTAGGAASFQKVTQKSPYSCILRQGP